MRGEQITETLRDGDFVGSPPLARGTVGAVSQLRPGAGITPACAGNSLQMVILTEYFRDHPRLRGEQYFYFCHPSAFQGSPPLARGTAIYARMWGFVKGSPPLARGTGYARLRMARGRRITPACAGNSNSNCFPIPLSWDHPRLRGEQHRRGQGPLCRLGSPPLARGTGLHCISPPA